MPEGAGVVPFNTDEVQGFVKDSTANIANQGGFIGVGTDGTNTLFIRTDSTGRQVVVGAVASGAAVAGSPVLVGGSDGTNAVTLQVDSSGRVVVVRKSDTSGVTSVNTSATVVTLQASNSGRLHLTIYNRTNITLYVKLGATATAIDFTVRVDRRQTYEVPGGYTGIVTGIWEHAGTGAALMTELT